MPSTLTPPVITTGVILGIVTSLWLRKKATTSSTSSSSSPEAFVPQFVTGDFQPQRVFLPDREYGLALDALVKACSDILIVSADGKKVLLGKRKVEPQPDWWFIGGRAKPGDTTRSAASRNVKRELGLDVTPNRFKAIATYSMVWQRRAQPPVENGTADISTVHVLQLTAAEEAQVVLDPKEYDASGYVTLDAVLAGSYHPCLKQAVRDLRKQHALTALYAAVEAGGDIENEARAFIAAHREATQLQESTRVRFEGGAYVIR